MKAIAPALLCSVLLVSVSASAQSVRIASVASNDLVYDRVRDKLYASVPGSAGANGNSIAVINPASGAVETYVWVGSEPNQLALSDDGQYLYVGLDGAYAIRRIDLTTLTPGLQFGLGSSSSRGRYVARDIAVVPGDAASVAVVRRASSYESIAVFTDGVIRPVATTESYSSCLLAFGSAGRLYAQNSGSYYRELFRMYVTPAGVAIADAPGRIMSGSVTGIQFSQGRLYASSGTVADPEALVRLAKLPTASSSEFLTDVAVNEAAGTVYAIVGTAAPQSLRADDLATWRPRWTAAVAGTLGTWRSLATAGESRLAFRSTSSGFSHVVIVDLAASSALTVSKRGTGNGTVTSTPGGIQCGVACAALFPATSSVTLTATPTTGAAFVRWDGDADCADGVVSMSAARTCTAVFAQTTIGPSIELPLSVNDLAYSPATGLIYASVPGRDPVLGNSVSAIDPQTGAVEPSVRVGSEPNKLAVSSDGGTLYVGLDGAAAVRPVDLTSLTAGPQFPLGHDSYAGPLVATTIAVAPDDAGTVAVVRKVDGTSSDHGVGIYTGGVVRPVVTSGVSGPRGLTFSAVGTWLYSGSGDDDLLRMGVDSAGVVVLDSLEDVWEGSGVRFSAGKLYSDRGRVVDEEAMAVSGSFPLSAGSGSAVCPDASRGVVYFLERPSSSTLYLRLYDAERFTRRQSIALSGANGTASSFIATGPGRLAFRTDTGQLFLLPHVGVVAARPSRDFDGDVQADAAVYRPASGTWLMLKSSTDNSTFGTRGWGVQAEGDTPVTGDFDGDGKTDAAVYRASTGTWYVRPSSGVAPWSVVFGEAGDVPLITIRWG